MQSRLRCWVWMIKAALVACSRADMSWCLSTWAEDNFGGCDFGDIRRTKRIVQMANLTINNPDSSLPAQMTDWAGLRAAYRLFHCEDVTAESVGQSHWRHSLENARGETLVLCDTTEIDFGSRRDIDGTGPTGNGSGNGFLLHNALLVDATSKEVWGLGAQVIHTRPTTPIKDNAARKLKRKRESQVWGKAVDMIGRAREGANYTVVGDRGADNFEFFVHLVENGHDWNLRAKSLNRIVLDASGERVSLAKAMEAFPYKGSYELQVVATKQRQQRTAHLEVFSGTVDLPLPRNKSPYVRQHAPESIRTNVIVVRELNPPSNKEAMSWVIYTSHPASTFAQCYKSLETYECRWMIEEFHKALKTGCRVESHQLQTTESLQPLVAYLSVVAVALLQIRSHARTDPDEKASKTVPANWLKMLKAMRRKTKRVCDITIREFYRQIAMLGGFLGRKSDGEPGWQTLWRGWHKLHMFLQGAEALKSME